MRLKLRRCRVIGRGSCVCAGGREWKVGGLAAAQEAQSWLRDKCRRPQLDGWGWEDRDAGGEIERDGRPVSRLAEQHPRR